MNKYDFVIRTTSQEAETVRLFKQPEEGLQRINPKITLATYKNGESIHYDEILIEALKKGLRFTSMIICSANVAKTNFEFTYIGNVDGNRLTLKKTIQAHPKQMQSNMIRQDGMKLNFDMMSYMEFTIQPGQWIDISLSE